MSDEPTTPAEHHPDEPHDDNHDDHHDDQHDGHDEGIVQPVGSPEHLTDEQLENYDLDGDGKISLMENERARLGIIDARLEQIAEEGGVKGFIAGAAHHVVDRLDNDETDNDEHQQDEHEGA